MTSRTVVELLSALPNNVEVIATVSHVRWKRRTDRHLSLCIREERESPERGDEVLQRLTMMVTHRKRFDARIRYRSEVALA